MSENRFYFSLGAVALRDPANKTIVGSSRITGSLTADISAPLVDTMGGASSFSSGARQGRSSGELTVALNERPTWVDRLLNEGNQDNTAASASSNVGTVANVVGSALAAKLDPGVATGASPVGGKFTVTATGAAAVNIDYVTPTGAGSVALSALGTTGQSIAQTGVELAASSASPAFTVGNVAVFEVVPAHDGIAIIRIPQVRRGQEYELIAYSAPGGVSDVVETVTFPRVMFAGAGYTLTDNEPSNGIEITGKVLAPADGSEVMIRESLSKA